MSRDVQLVINNDNYYSELCDIMFSYENQTIITLTPPV